LSTAVNPTARAPLERAGPQAAADAVQLDVEGLEKAFHGVAVLKGIGFTVRHGEVVALVGANGSGKSTLLRCCVGLLRPDAGAVRLLGERVAEVRGRRLRRLRGRTAVIWQRHNLVPRLSVLSNVIHGAQSTSDSPLLWFRATAAAEVRANALAALAAVGLAHLADRRSDQISGGESQRVAVARALMQRPRLVFADEPAASLDPKVGEEVMTLLAEELRRRGMTLIFISHNLHDALRFSHRVLGLRRGRIELDALSASLKPSDLRGFYE
jgi:phosphonate transport system ATP-binding protein